MKVKRFLLLLAGTTFGISTLSGCAINWFEETINVQFVNGGELVAEGTVTQFKNIKTPTLASGYIPEGYRFLGWTGYSKSQLDLENPARFKTQYIGDGRMVHYMDVKKFAKNHAVILNSLCMKPGDIPKEYHYAVVAWYDKAGTSGLTTAKMNAYEEMVKTYLLGSGVSQDDVNTLVFRPYSGNVGPTTGQILYDGDVDIMMGWGSLDNITTTGSIPPESVLESVSLPVLYDGATKNRWIHRLTDTVGSLALIDYMKSEASMTYFGS